MENIIFDDFLKLNIRIGKIISAERVEKSDKLLKLEVDFGEEKRQILSGIYPYYEPEDLIGKKCPFIVNLEPRKIMGLESQGMILAADDEGRPVLMHPDHELPEGSPIR